MKTGPSFSAEPAECDDFFSFPACLIRKVCVYYPIMKKMTSKILLLSAAVFVAGILSGCAVVDKDTSLFAPHKWDEIFRNRENLAKLRTGMTKDEVLKIMGEPIKDEVYCEDNVWWYYIRTCWTDFRTTRDECAPVVFDEEGLVEGWGASYFRNTRGYVWWSDKAVKKVLE